MISSAQVIEQSSGPRVSFSFAVLAKHVMSCDVHLQLTCVGLPLCKLYMKFTEREIPTFLLCLHMRIYTTRQKEIA